jgi:membrane dipeptidase
MFALCVSPACCGTEAARKTFKLIDRYYHEIESNKDLITHCNSFKDILTTFESGKICSVLSVEGGEALLGEISALRVLYRLGVRSLCLTHNARNEIADGASFSSTGGGLTPFGKEVVKEMNRLGMIIDISHIAEKGFYDVAELSQKPIIASHSDVKALCDHVRNLTDRQILTIKEKQGVIGVNYYSKFLTDKGTGTIKDIINHIEYIASLAGIDHVGLGSDFDGIDMWPSDMAGVEHINGIFNELAKLNYTDDEISKIAGGNFMRIAEQIL